MSGTLILINLVSSSLTLYSSSLTKPFKTSTLESFSLSLLYKEKLGYKNKATNFA